MHHPIGRARRATRLASLATTTTLTLTALALTALALTACTSGKPPQIATLTPPPSSASGTPSTATATPTSTTPLTTGPLVSPGETPPTLSSYARQHDSAGALAFAAYYYKALDWALATTNSAPLVGLGLSSCVSCDKNIKSIDDVAGLGGEIVSGRITVDSSRIVQGQFKYHSDFVIELVVSEDPIVVSIPGEGRSTDTPRVNQNHNLVFVSWRSRGWRVVEIGAPS